jgi:hypothetical protein
VVIPEQNDVARVLRRHHDALAESPTKGPHEQAQLVEVGLPVKLPRIEIELDLAGVEEVTIDVEVAEPEAQELGMIVVSCEDGLGAGGKRPDSPSSSNRAHQPCVRTRSIVRCQSERSVSKT